MTSISIYTSRSSRRVGRIPVNATGMALAVVTGAIHLVWAVLVAAGVGQRLVDIAFRLHFIRPAYVTDAFDPLRAILLVLLSAAAGYALGAIFALVWNRLPR